MVVWLMRAKCPKCGAVFEVSVGPSLVHMGPWRSTKCPACGKRSITNNFVKDPITWPPEAADKTEAPPMSDEELKEKRLEESKFEQGEG
jgi:ribosomal protein S27AE